MPRDASGNYTKPNASVIPGDIISSAEYNSTINDISTEITSSLDRNGRGGMLTSSRFEDGDVANPAITFNLQPSLGIFRPSDGYLSVAAGGNEQMRVSDADQIEQQRGGQWAKVLDENSTPTLEGSWSFELLDVTATVAGGDVQVVVENTDQTAGSTSTVTAKNGTDTVSLIASGDDDGGAVRAVSGDLRLEAPDGIIQFADDVDLGESIEVNAGGGTATVYARVGSTGGVMLEANDGTPNGGAVRATNGNLRVVSSSGTIKFLTEAATLVRSQRLHVETLDGTSQVVVQYIDGNNWFLQGNGSDLINRKYLDIALLSGNLTIPGQLFESSDERAKLNIRPMANTSVLSWRGIDWDGEDGRKRSGLSAQDVYNTNPEFVSVDEGGNLSLSYSRVVSVLVEEIKRLHHRVAGLQTLAGRVDRLERRA